MKKVSIIIPAYNAEKTVERCINSLINQDYANIEIILLNDGSTDKTHDIVTNFKDKRIIYIKKKNSGIGDTRNRGIELSTGDYIMFLDSDDYVEPNCISTLVKKIEENNSELVISDYFIDTTSTIQMHIDMNGPTSLKENPNILTKVNMAPWNKLYAASLFKNTDNRFVVGLKYEDAPVVVQAIRDAKKIDFVHSCLFHYVITKKGETLTRDARIFDIFKICKIIEDKLKDYSYCNKTNLIVKMLTYYLKNSRYIDDAKLKNEFLNKAFSYLNDLDPNWRKNEYLKEMSYLKRFVITHKLFLKALK